MARPTSKSKVVFTKEQLDMLTSEYSDIEIALMFNVWQTQVTKNRIKYNIKSYYQKTGLIKVAGKAITKTEDALSRIDKLHAASWEAMRGRPQPKSRKNFYDESFFETIDTEEKAYTLGLIVADGSISKCLGVVSLALKQTDKQILEDIAKAINYNAELKLLPRKTKGLGNGDDRIRLRLNSVKMVKDLIKLGVTPAKTFTARLPVVSPKLEPHLIRGIWDGDGHIGRSMSCLVGNIELITDVIKCLDRHNLPVPILEPLKSIYRLRLRKCHKPILDWCYGCNPSIVLKRKYTNYLVF